MHVLRRRALLSTVAARRTQLRRQLGGRSVVAPPTHTRLVHTRRKRGEAMGIRVGGAGSNGLHALRHRPDHTLPSSNIHVSISNAIASAPMHIAAARPISARDLTPQQTPNPSKLQSPNKSPSSTGPVPPLAAGTVHVPPNQAAGGTRFTFSVDGPQGTARSRSVADRSRS
jgi:hypothetical protein